MFLIAVLAVGLPLRVLSMPICACCADDMAEVYSHATEHDGLQADFGHGFSDTIDCPAKHSPTRMSHPLCTATCGAVAATTSPTSLDEAAWTGVLVAHRDSSFLSVVLALLERPPNTFSA